MCFYSAEKHPEAGVSGNALHVFGAKGGAKKWQKPLYIKGFRAHPLEGWVHLFCLSTAKFSPHRKVRNGALSIGQ